jgi:hypothetical protein
MPTVEQELRRRERVREALARRTPDQPGGRGAADGALGLWSGMAARLEPVIGPQGVDVLLVRALQLTAFAHPWLAGNWTDPATRMETLRTRFEAEEAAEAALAGQTLLTTLLGLLESLIGASLTERLLGPVWAPPEPGPAREATP